MKKSKTFSDSKEYLQKDYSKIKEKNAAFASGDFTGYNNILNMFKTANNFYFGYETWWKAAPALIDDVYFCASPLSALQAAALYNATKK